MHIAEFLEPITEERNGTPGATYAFEGEEG